MTWLRALSCCLALLLAAPAAAQAPGPRSRIDEISTLRLDLERLAEGRRQVRAQRDALAQRLEGLAREIERRKTGGAGDSLLPDFKLQGDLRTSQELSESVTLLNRELDQLEDAYRERLERLASLYDEAVEGTVSALHAAGQAERGDLTRVLARLRSERAAVRRELAPAQANPGGVDPEPGATQLASDDPEELAERADAVQDEQDKLRQKLARLDARIAALERELRLDREMRDFLTDQDLFGEQSRVLRVPRDAAAEKSEDSIPGRADELPPAETDGDMAYENGECDPSAGGTWSGGESLPPQTPFTPQPAPADGSLPVGVEADGAAAPGADRPQGLPALHRERGALVERLKRLQVLHDRLREKAEALSGE